MVFNDFNIDHPNVEPQKMCFVAWTLLRAVRNSQTQGLLRTSDAGPSLAGLEVRGVRHRVPSTQTHAHP